MFAFHLHVCVGVFVCMHLYGMHLHVSVFALYSDLSYIQPGFIYLYIIESLRSLEVIKH